MSPRAAWRLERLGFGPVHDYAWGKVDWLAAGLPTEGEGKRERRAVDVMEEPLTCPPTAKVSDAVERAREAGAPNVLVKNEDGILLGRLRLDSDAEVEPDQTVEAVMEPGPVTVRANEPLDPLLERMAKRGVTEVVVTTPDGRLLGVVRR
jgi:CBS domain-containing protein